MYINGVTQYEIYGINNCKSIHLSIISNLGYGCVKERHSLFRLSIDNEVMLQLNKKKLRFFATHFLLTDYYRI